MKKKLKIVIIGAGYAGKRFIRALSYLQKQDDGLLLEGVVDVDELKLVDLPDGVKTEKNLSKALDLWRPDVAVVCVNEYGHYEVLKSLCESSVSTILCEKPLTATLAEAQDIELRLGERFISLNLVERFSPIISMCKTWLSERPDISVRRAEFFWGKHRMRDARPSIGVSSEAIHPIDLVRLLFGVERLDIDVASGVVSDMQPNGAPVIDGVYLMFGDGTLPVLGQSSFAWPGRDRRIVAFAGNGVDLFRIVLQFDKPFWDCDQLTISSINPQTGATETIYEYATTNDDFPAELNQIYKVSQFVKESLKSVRGETTSIPLVDRNGALKLQTILHNIVEEVKTRPAQLVAGG